MCISIPLGLSLLAAAFVLAVFWRHDGKSSGRLEAKAVEGLLLCGPHKLRESVCFCFDKKHSLHSISTIACNPGATADQRVFHRSQSHAAVLCSLFFNLSV